MIPIKIKDPTSGEDKEFKSKADAIIYLLKVGVTKPQICLLLNCTHQHIHITERLAKLNGKIV